MRRVRRGLSCRRDRFSENGDGTDPIRSAPSGPDPIEVESYRILRSRIDLTPLPRLTRAVTERVIHASADFDYATDLICDESALAAGIAAITRGAPVVTDVGMVAAGITGYPVICKIGDSLRPGWRGPWASPSRPPRPGWRSVRPVPVPSGWSAARRPRWRRSCAGTSSRRW